MSTTQNKKSFVKSKTFIIFTTLASVFFVLFLVSAIMMGIRYTSCWKTITTFMKNTGIYDSHFEEAVIWKYFLMSSSNLSKPLETPHGDITLSVDVVKQLTSDLPKWNLNLIYTITTIVGVFAFVITAFVPLAWCMCKLNEKRVAKKELKKAQKEKILEAKGN